MKKRAVLPANDKKIDQLLSLGIGIALLAVLVLGFLLVGPDIISSARQKLSSIKNPPKSFQIEETKIEGPVREIDAKEVHAFLREALRSEVMPTMLSFSLASPPDTEGPQVYIANWNQDGKIVNVLLGKTPDGKNLDYMRIWTMPPGENVTPKQGEEILSGLFAPEYLAALGAIICGQMSDPETQEQVTNCARIKTMDDGSLRGLTVRAPFMLPPPPDLPEGSLPKEKVIIASTCFIPQVTAASYRDAGCQ